MNCWMWYLNSNEIFLEGSEIFFEKRRINRKIVVNEIGEDKWKDILGYLCIKFYGNIWEIDSK